jgi:hypothetical protein
MLLITDIDWDTDGEDPIACNLPENIVVIHEHAGIKPSDDMMEQITNQVSDVFGWCIKQLCWDEVETNPIFLSSTATVDIR